MASLQLSRQSSICLPADVDPATLEAIANARQQHQAGGGGDLELARGPPGYYANQAAKAIKAARSDSLASRATTATAAEQQYKPTLRRYLIIVLFCMNSGNKSYQWLQVISVTTKATQLYGVDNYMINICSIIFMLAFVLLSWPACYVIENTGMRKAVLMAAFGTSLGAVIKCFSCHRDGIWLLMAGQICVALAEQLVFSVPSKLAAVWFPDHQVSLCVALCIVGCQLGLVVGFLLPDWFLKGAEDEEAIAQGFYNMFLATAAYSLTIFVLCLIFFDEAPKHAPGAARQKQIDLAKKQQLEFEEASKANGGLGVSAGPSTLARVADLLRQVAALFCNVQLMMLATTYGLIVGVAYTIQTLLDQTLNPVWPEDDTIVGLSGFFSIIAGIVTTPLWGKALDRWHNFKAVSIILALGTLGSLLLFAYAIAYFKSILAVYVASALFGLFSTGYIASGLEYAVEVTYPAPELITSSVMNLMPMIHSCVYILIGSYIVDNYGPFATNIFYSGLVVLALVLLAIISAPLKRQEAIAQMGVKPKRTVRAVH